MRQASDKAKAEKARKLAEPKAEAADNTESPKS